MNDKTEKQTLRDTLTADIIKRVQSTIREELFFESLSEDRREAIEAQVLAYTRHVVDALTYGEMQSEGALLSHIADARCDVNRMVREYQATA